MSHIPPTNPYGSPTAYEEPPPHAAAPVRGIPKVTGMRYMESFQYIFESPNWAMNLLFGALAVFSQSFVPIIGPMVFMGYLAEVLTHLHRRRTMPYPDFDFNRFGEYISRGAPPLVVMLLAWMINAGVMLFFYFAGIFGTMLIAAALAAAGLPGPAVMLVVIFLGAIAIATLIAAMITLAMYASALMLRGELTGKVGEAFDFGFAKRYVSLMWREMFVAFLWLTLANFVVTFLGLLALCLGVYPAVAWTMMARTHINWQLYELYLGKGGEPIPLPDEHGMPAV